jgi:hypothetical protein
MGQSAQVVLLMVTYHSETSQGVFQLYNPKDLQAPKRGLFFRVKK